MNKDLNSTKDSTFFKAVGIDFHIKIVKIDGMSMSCPSKIYRKHHHTQILAN